MEIPGTSSFLVIPLVDQVMEYDYSGMIAFLAENKAEREKQRKEELEMDRALLNYYSEVSMIRRALERIASRC